MKKACPNPMRKALLIYLYSKGEPGISLALGFIKAYADADAEIRKAWSLEILHTCLDTDLQEVVAAIERSEADVVGFSCYSWNVQAVQHVVSRLSPETRPLVVLGGVEVTPDPQRVLRGCRNVDVVVVDEGEETFGALLRGLDEDFKAPVAKNLDGIEGIVWRQGRSIRSNPPRPPIADLSSIPSPYLSGTFGDTVLNVSTIPLESTRGCPFSCTYCFEPRGFKKLRVFPLDRVKEEVTHLVGLGVSQIEFFDTNVNFNRKRSVEMFRFLGSLKRRVRFWFEIMAELLDEEQIQALADLEFFAEVGLQSTNLRALKAVKRTLNKEKFEVKMLALMNASIYRPCSYSPLLGVMIDLMGGLPHDSLPDILQSFDYTFGLVPSRIGFSVLKVLPGTELFDEAKKHRCKFDPKNNHMITSTSSLSKQDVRDLVNFKDAVDAAYNKIHAVRTIGWMAEELQTRPSDVFLEIGRHMGEAGRYWDDYTMKGLSVILADICKNRGNARAARKVGSRLAAETMLNLLQNVKEKRRSVVSRLLFGLGYKFLTLFWGLPPLPESTRRQAAS